MNRRRAVMLLELLTVVAIAGILTFAVASSFGIVVTNQRKAPEARAASQNQRVLESRLTGLIRTAFVDSDQANPNTYFIARTDPEADSLLSSTEAATELIFTQNSGQIPGALLSSQEASFEQRNQDLGPQGGVTEVRFGTTPLGESGVQQGLFLREQTPADGDPEQGGYESLIDSSITQISFEMWNGQEWLGLWDTQSGDRRLPAAVRVTYQLQGEDPSTPAHRFVVRLEGSDVTAANPDTAQAFAGGTP